MMNPSMAKPYEVKGGYLEDGTWGAGFWTVAGFYIFVPQIDGKSTDECLNMAVDIAGEIGG